MMVRINTILLAALSILAPAVQASPSSEVSFLGHRATTPIEETADFEDLQVTGFSAQELGEYKNAKFIGLSLASSILASGTIGVTPSSGTKFVYSGVLNELTTADEPAITLNYPGTAFYPFDFKSFSFGCIIVALPAECTLTVTGYYANKKIDSQTYNYVAVGTEVSEPMMQVTLPDTFMGIDTVLFSTEYPLVSSAGATVYDDFVYDLYPAPQTPTE